jgi:hypothetical protein
LTNGGSPITNYRIKLCNADTGSIVGSNIRYFSSGPTLVNGQTYEALIQACNANGFGEAAYFRPFQPGSPPSQPSTISTIVVGTSNVLVTWTPPSVTPNATINWYALYARPVGATNNLYEVTADGLTQRNYLLSNFNTSCNYTFELSAVNGPGWSPSISSFLQFVIPTDYFEPNDLQGLNLWLDAADTTTYTLSGLNVTQWNDKSGLGYNTNCNVAGPVTLAVNSLNTCNTFKLNSGAFRGPFNYTASTFTNFIVVSQDTIPNTNRRYLSLGSSNLPDWGSNAFTFTGTPGSSTFPIGVWRNFPANVQTSLFVPASNRYYIVETGYTGSHQFISADGGNVSCNASSGPFSFNSYAVGVNTGDFTDGRFAGNVAEVLFYRQNLPTFYNQQIEGYLAWKWGLQSNLPATHPYRSTRPLNPGLISPYTAPNLSFWLDATRISTISSGTALTRWNDITSNAYVGTAVNGPVYQSSIFNGYMPAVTFNGANQYINYGDVLDIRTSSISIFATFVNSNTSFGLINKTIYTGAPNKWAFFSDTTNANVGTLFLLRDSTSGDVYPSQGGGSCNTQLYNATWNRQTISLFRNGTNLCNVSFSSAGDINSAYNLYVGALNDNTGTGVQSGFFLNGAVGEILVFMSTPIESTRQKIEGYLSWKWGLTQNLPGNHPYKFYPPLSNYSSIAINTSTIFATNFNQGNDIGFTNFSNAQLISSQTITGTGIAYNTSNTSPSVIPSKTFTSLTTNRVTWCASLYRIADAGSFNGIMLTRNTYNGSTTPATGMVMPFTSNRVTYLWDGGAINDPVADAFIPLNTWTHAAVTISPTEARVYINGINVDTRTSNFTALTFTEMTIGNDIVLSNTRFFPGYIDNVRFYTSTLTSNEIQAIYYNTQFI